MCACTQGLGKTLQTIAFLAYMQAERGVQGPSLVVVPLSVISSWLAEFRRWAPHLRVVRVHGADIAEKLRVRNEARAPKAHHCTCAALRTSTRFCW